VIDGCSMRMYNIIMDDIRDCLIWSWSHGYGCTYVCIIILKCYYYDLCKLIGTIGWTTDFTNGNDISLDVSSANARKYFILQFHCIFIKTCIAFNLIFSWHCILLRILYFVGRYCVCGWKLRIYTAGFDRSY